MSFDSLPRPVAKLAQGTQNPSSSSDSSSTMGDIMARSDLKSMVPQPRAYKKGPQTVEASGFEKVKGETIPRRNPACKDGLKMRPTEEVATVYDIVKYSSKKFGNAKAMGSRKLIRTHDEVKKITKVVDGKETTQDKKWTYYELSEYSYISFVEYEKQVNRIGAALRHVGMTKGDRVHLFAATRFVQPLHCFAK